MNAVNCPQCHAPMIAEPTPDRRTLVKQMVETGSKEEYAAHRADSRLEKEQAHGVVHVCIRCRYTTRVKDAA